MSGRPPDEGMWDGVLDHVKKALEDSEIRDATLRGALLEGVEDALGNLGDIRWVFGGIRPEDRTTGQPATATGPEIELVMGGRQEDSPSPAGEKPDLRVAEPESQDSQASDIAEEADSASPAVEDQGMRTNVRVLPLQGFGRSLRGLTAEGAVQVEPGTLQTLYRGNVERSYRVTCRTGALRVVLDGMPMDTVAAGQSVDVDGTLVQVSGAEEEQASEGGYARIP